MSKTLGRAKVWKKSVALWSAIGAGVMTLGSIALEVAQDPLNTIPIVRPNEIGSDASPQAKDAIGKIWKLHQDKSKDLAKYLPHVVTLGLIVLAAYKRRFSNSVLVGTQQQADEHNEKLATIHTPQKRSPPKRAPRKKGVTAIKEKLKKSADEIDAIGSPEPQKANSKSRKKQKTHR